ncbi:hypothetical protein SRHO_G00276700 [Serrasalmus rhombeus]
MKTSVAVMRSLAAVAIVAFTIWTSADAEKVSPCCVSVSRSRVVEPLKSFRLQKSSPPCVKAVIFETEKGPFCIDPRQPWVREKIEEFVSRVVEPLKSFRLQKSSPPCVKAVIFETEKGPFCIDPRQPWVREKIEEFRRQQKMTEVSNVRVTSPDFLSATELNREQLNEPAVSAVVSSAHTSPDITTLKLELLASLRKDIAEIFKKDLQETLGDVLSSIKSDLNAVKTQLAPDKAAIDATVSDIKNTVGEMERALTVCSDDVSEMKASIKSLTAQVNKLEDKCEDLESRSRRNNVRIVGMPEGPDTCTTSAVAVMLKDAFGLEKEPLLDRSHLTLQPKPKPGDRPRAIVCRFHYHSDCVDILRRAREL